MLKAEKLSDEDRTDGGKYTIKPTRSFDIFLGGYSANVTIENNEEWQYVSIPVEKFKLVSTSNAIKNIKTLNYKHSVHKTKK